MNKIFNKKLITRIIATFISLVMLLTSTTILPGFKTGEFEKSDRDFKTSEHRTESIENLTLNNLPEELKRSLDMSKVDRCK